LARRGEAYQGPVPTVMMYALGISGPSLVVFVFPLGIGVVLGAQGICRGMGYCVGSMIAPAKVPCGSRGVDVVSVSLM